MTNTTKSEAALSLAASYDLAALNAADEATAMEYRMWAASKRGQARYWQQREERAEALSGR